MRIALVDNMNNNFFAMARYLRMFNADVSLYVMPGSPNHFSPQEDTFKNLEELTWIKEFPIDYRKDWFFINRRSLDLIRGEFREYDRIVVCGVALGLLNQSGIKCDLFIPYGGDLINDPFFRIPKTRSIKKFLRKLAQEPFKNRYQKKGIRECGSIISNNNWSVADKALNMLGRESVNMPRLMVFIEKEESKVDRRWEFMDSHDFVVFSPTRHLWKTNAEPLPDFKKEGGAKRNDRLIRAFASIVSEGIYKTPLLILFEYGSDVEESKKLIKELGMFNNVVWMKMQPRKFLIRGMAKATFIADQFRMGMCATSAGTTNEALAVGVPVITNTDGAIYNDSDPYFEAPILQALTEEEIYSYLKDYYSNPEKYLDLKDKSVQWFNRNLGNGLAIKYMEILELIR
tara:strand:- start:1248 stop:2450 length:1203 start_codon:yes stop_codon:yes gene_type:complete